MGIGEVDLGVVHTGRVLRHCVGFIGLSGSGVHPKAGGALDGGCGHVEGEFVTDGQVVQAAAADEGVIRV